MKKFSWMLLSVALFALQGLAQEHYTMGLGYVEGVTHDYVRHGTTTLFAALDIATGIRSFSRSCASALAPSGGFSQVFVFESVREFEVSTRTVNHVPTPSGCGAVDEAQLTLFFASRFGFSNVDALALARKVIRGPMRLTVGFVERLGSVSDFDFSAPALQVWSD